MNDQSVMPDKLNIAGITSLSISYQAAYAKASTTMTKIWDFLLGVQVPTQVDQSDTIPLEAPEVTIPL